MDILLLEASSSKKKYGCPYCNFRGEREELVAHIEDEHEDLIPEGFTSSRLVFNIVNKKDVGRCVICQTETEWDESVCRYKRTCSDKCEKQYVEIFRSRMINKYGKATLLNDEQHQIQMLKNRRISGTYKFSDGKVKEYVGSFEKKALEFEDEVLRWKSSDLLTPGPTIEYEYNGETHLWITDQYFAPYNLVIEIKDGGDNPNNRDMKSYREKQVAKEEALIKSGQYNYIRLTNNNFAQLLMICAVMKKNLTNGDDSNTIMINEEVENILSPIKRFLSMDNVYIIIDESNSLYVSNDPLLEEMIGVDGTKLVKRNIKTIGSYQVYRVKNKNAKEKFKTIVHDMDNDISVDENYIFNKFLESVYHPRFEVMSLMEAFKYQEDIFENVSNDNLPEYFKTIEEITVATFLDREKHHFGFNIPVYESEISEELLLDEEVHIFTDGKGNHYLQNINTNLRSPSIPVTEGFSDITKMIIKRGIL